jgi:predicted GNAT superfamily acetyltransferase
MNKDQINKGINSDRVVNSVGIALVILLVAAVIRLILALCGVI